MQPKRVRYFIVPLILFCTACSASLRPTMPLPHIPPATLSKEAKPAGEHYVSIEGISDARSSKALAVKGVQQSLSVNDVGIAVQSALQQNFRNAGFVIDGSAPIVLRGQVRKWLSEIKPGMSSALTAEAEIFLEVFDPANKRIYSGTYQGFSTIKNPSLSLEEISDSLGVAMSQALGQIVNDKALVQLLMSF